MRKECERNYAFFFSRFDGALAIQGAGESAAMDPPRGPTPGVFLPAQRR